MRIKIPGVAGKWKLPALLIAMNFIAAWSYAQITINGRATDNDGKGIPATVQVKNTTFGGLGDVDGNYSFSAPLKQGKYVLVFSSVGFKTAETALVVNADNSYSVNITLSPD